MVGSIYGALRTTKVPRIWCIVILVLVFSSLLLSSGKLRSTKLVNHPLPLSPPRFELLYPVQYPDRTDVWQDLNAVVLRSLLSCTANASCERNQTRVVLLASYHFPDYVMGMVSGEKIWAASIQSALQQMGYTFLFARDLKGAIEHYRMFPHLVKVVIAEAHDITACFHDNGCVKTSSNRHGIPIWKMFTFHYWASANHPLGAQWTLSPEDYRNGNQYIGYSVEGACRPDDVVPSHQRGSQIYILGKELSYFYNSDYVWDDGAFSRLRESLGIRLVAGIQNHTGFHSIYPPDIDNLGSLSKEEFHTVLSHSRALLGIGSPIGSPSPYEALCLGVPYINPILALSEQWPSERSPWVTQHDGLKWLDPPYVYHVRRMDVDGLVEAVKAAIAAPIERYIPPAMRLVALRERVAHLVENDWRSLAQELRADREKSNDRLEFDL